MDQNNHREYSAGDFERYYSGKMPEMEMHALEKAALQDPFLADALEGYQYTQTPYEDVEDLKKRLSADKKKGRLFFLQNPAWFKVAAFIILFAGAGYFIYLFNSGLVNQMATNHTEEMANVTSDSILIADSDTLQKKEFEANGDNQIASKVPDSTVTAKSVTSKKNRTQSSLPESDTSLPQNDNEVAVNFEKREKPGRSLPAPGIKRETKISSKVKEDVAANNTIAGQIMDDNGYPVPFATVTDLKKNLATTADASGKFILSTTDSVLIARVAAVGFKAENYDLAKNENNPVVLQRDSTELSSVIVTTGLGIRKKNKNYGYLSSKIISAGDSLYGPKGGWDNFFDYISENTSNQTNESGEEYTGEVIISFEANKKGTPYSIKIDQSLCDSCDREAIRLIRQGAKWIYSNGKRYLVSINF